MFSGGIMNIGLPEILLILFIVLILFGAKKLPEVARSMGKSMKEFKDGMKEGMENQQNDEQEKK
jgi:sec-independent protein translocase protein TatA